MQDTEEKRARVKSLLSMLEDAVSDATEPFDEWTIEDFEEAADLMVASTTLEETRAMAVRWFDSFSPVHNTVRIIANRAAWETDGDQTEAVILALHAAAETIALQYSGVWHWAPKHELRTAMLVDFQMALDDVFPNDSRRDGLPRIIARSLHVAVWRDLEWLHSFINADVWR